MGAKKRGAAPGHEFSSAAVQFKLISFYKKKKKNGNKQRRQKKNRSYLLCFSLLSLLKQEHRFQGLTSPA